MNSTPTMTPVVFDGCFGWLHRPAQSRDDAAHRTSADARTDARTYAQADAPMAAILCSPFGYDALCVHRGWRDLAEALAAAGVPALRFDYPGAGDSSGNEDDPQRVRAWLDSIKAAAALLQAETGAVRLTLCGLRLGATLAALAAEELGGVDNLVLLMPAVSGKAYLRELEIQHRNWLSTPDGKEGAALRDAAADINAQAAQATQAANAPDSSNAVRPVGAYGFRLFPDTLAPLAAIDLEQRTVRPAARVLVQDICAGARVDRLLVRYRAQGAHAELQLFPEYGRFLLDPHFSVPPRDAFDGVLRWLGLVADATVTTNAADSKQTPAATRAVQVCPAAWSARIEFAGGSETPAVFGGGRYVGVFCAPRRALDGAPAVLFVNTGGVHRVGDGRLAVVLARRLAAQGIASLRMDVAGLGDSQRRDAALTLDALYADAALVDAKAGVDWLAAAGHARTVMFGVCTGAYVSLHTALAHPGVVGCMAVNLPFFAWGGARTRPGAQHVESSRVYGRSLRDPRKWARLLSGRANGYAIVTELVRRGLARIGARASGPLERLLGLSTPSGAIRALAADLDRKGVHTSLVYGPLDEGLDELAIHFGPNGKRLNRLKHVDVNVIARVDHALFSPDAREVVMAQFERFLRTRVTGVVAAVTGRAVPPRAHAFAGAQPGAGASGAGSRGLAEAACATSDAESQG